MVFEKGFDVMVFETSSYALMVDEFRVSLHKKP